MNPLAPPLNRAGEQDGINGGSIQLIAGGGSTVWSEAAAAAA